MTASVGRSNCRTTDKMNEKKKWERKRARQNEACYDPNILTLNFSHLHSMAWTLSLSFIGGPRRKTAKKIEAKRIRP